MISCIILTTIINEVNRELKNWLLLLFLSVIWGSSFILMKRGMEVKVSGEAIFSNQQVATLRMLIASSALLPFGIRHFFKRHSPQMFVSLAVVCFLGNFIPAFLFTYAETGINSGLAGMLNSCTPIFTILLGVMVFKQRIVLLQIVGVCIGTLGLIWLVNSANSVGASGSILPILAVVLATLFYAASVNTIKFTLKGIRAVKITSMAFSLAFLPSLLLFFYYDTAAVFESNPHAWNGLIYISVLALVGTAFSVVVFNVLIANSTALFASSVTYFIPIVALVIGIFDGEEFKLKQVFAMIVILIGVYVANVLGNKKLSESKKSI